MDASIADGEIGGKAAALRLKDSIWEHLEYDFPKLSRDLRLVVRIYANMRGLSKIYCDTAVLKEREDFDRFVCGFNKDYAFYDYIDAGNGKECSDHKIRAAFSWGVSDPHCKHIIFGGSADNGYARMLGELDSNTRKHVSLLIGPPFAQEMARLADNFETMSDPKVFRDSKIATRRPPATNNDHPNPKASSWANTASTPASLGTAKGPVISSNKTIDISPLKTIVPDKFDPKFIALNSHGQRVDLPIKYSVPLIAGLKSRKLCNNHHLAGYCQFDDQCKHEHGKLDDKSLMTLRHIARSNPCRSGLWCEDEDCYSGHRCTHGDCDGRICRFSEEMHDVDTAIVNR